MFSKHLSWGRPTGSPAGVQEWGQAPRSLGRLHGRRCPRQVGWTWLCLRQVLCTAEQSRRRSPPPAWSQIPRLVLSVRIGLRAGAGGKQQRSPVSRAASVVPRAPLGLEDPKGNPFPLSTRHLLQLRWTSRQWGGGWGAAGKQAQPCGFSRRKNGHATQG